MRRVPQWIGWIAFGALLEIAILFSALPRHSEDSLTTWQTIAGYILTPGGAVTGALAAIFGHALDRLPKMATVVVLLMFTAAFLAEAALLAFPFWAVFRLTLGRRRSI
jgi:MFS family permease